MSIRVDPSLAKEIKDYGAFDLDACFHCGNCTAVCPLSKDSNSFPRKIIRYSQLGLSEKMTASRELWLCYYCGECSETCPRRAEPGEFMAAARRHAIASFDFTGISRLLYRSKGFTLLLLAVVTALLTTLLLAMRGPAPRLKLELFQFIPFHVIHDLGMVVIALAAIPLVTGVIKMALLIKKASPAQKQEEPDEKKSLVTAFKQVFKELSLQKNFSECEDNKSTQWYLNRRILHLSIMWGFLGLGLATGLDYLLLLIADKAPGQPLPLWNPTRLLGTLTGLLLLWGTTWALFLRLKKPDDYYSHSLLSDWLFLLLLWFAAVTGFLVEWTLYLSHGAPWMYALFLVHIVVSLEVVLLLPFTKFAHAIYRPIALIMLALSGR